jgi:hypothetical protein
VAHGDDGRTRHLMDERKKILLGDLGTAEW